MRGRRRRPGLVLVLAVGVLVAMGAVLVVFAGGQGPGSAPPAAAAPAGAPADAVLHPVAAPPPAPVALTSEELARCPATSVACVDLAQRTAWLQRDGKVLTGPVLMLPGADTFRLPPGPTSSATPAGTFHVLRKDKDGYSTEFDEPMHHAVYFAPGGIAFHEGSLTASSNGCIHLSALDATTFYDQLRIGDGVTTF
jgi:hypothetical protein